MLVGLQVEALSAESNFLPSRQFSATVTLLTWKGQ